MKLPISFEFESGGKDFRLPTIDAYQFNADRIKRFEASGSYVPLSLDINLQTPCNLRCMYCFTSKGEEDRFEVSGSIEKLSDDELLEVISQFGRLGGSTIFMCSEGEPLVYPEYFMQFAKAAKDNSVKLVTYSNATTITPEFAKELQAHDVNLVLKLESLKPERNNRLLGTKKYNYQAYEGVIVPEQLVNVFNVYNSDLGKIAVSTMLTGQNLEDIMEIRKWAYEEMGITHFVKQLYIFGQAQRNHRKLSVSKGELRTVEEEIYKYDKTFGFEYPKGVADEYSYDIRRFLNNHLNKEGFPVRVFGHPRGGVYHNSNSVKTKFGFNEGHCVTMRDENEIIDLQKYFREIHEYITKNNND